jgi:hypothetical protein
MEKRINDEMADIIFYLEDTENIIKTQGTLATGSSSLNIQNIIVNELENAD